MIGPAFREEGHQLGTGARPLLEPGSPRGQELLDIQACQAPSERAAGVKEALEDRVDPRPERQDLAVRDQVERASHEAAPHCSPRLDEV